MSAADPRPILPFRVHFNDVSLSPFDIDACDAVEVRERMKNRLSDFQGWNLSRTHLLSNRSQRLTG